MSDIEQHNLLVDFTLNHNVVNATKVSFIAWSIDLFTGFKD